MVIKLVEVIFSHITAHVFLILHFTAKRDPNPFPQCWKRTIIQIWNSQSLCQALSDDVEEDRAVTLTMQPRLTCYGQVFQKQILFLTVVENVCVLFTTARTAQLPI